MTTTIFTSDEVEHQLREQNLEAMRLLAEAVKKVEALTSEVSRLRAAASSRGLALHSPFVVRVAGPDGKLSSIDGVHISLSAAVISAYIHRMGSKRVVVEGADGALLVDLGSFAHPNEFLVVELKKERERSRVLEEENKELKAQLASREAA